MLSSQNKSLHRDWIEDSALKVVEDLQKAGYESYFVGGCVRDLLVGLSPKDFDIATSATPAEVRKCISHSFIIGKRFRLVHVHRRDQVYEVATFRRDPSPEEKESDDLSGDNLFGDPQKDACRRDFTINGIFYDSVKDEIIDYVEGMQDIQDRCIRMIGEPQTRLLEDPIRILRALRLSHKLGFQIEPELREAMQSSGESLKRSVLPRKREELLKILKLKNAPLALQEAHDLDILENCFPTLNEVYQDTEMTQVFFHYMQFLNPWMNSNCSPTRLFSLLLYAYSKAKFKDFDETNTNYWNTETNSDLKVFLRDELGMFNAEQESLCNCFKKIPILKNPKKYQQMAAKQKIKFLSQDCFEMALDFSKEDFLVNAEDLHFWYREYSQKLPQILDHEDKKLEQAKKRKKQNYRKKAGNHKKKPSRKTDSH